MEESNKFETNLIHGGHTADKETGAIMPPIHLSSTFRQEGVGKHKGYEYSRTNNPTRSQLEKLVAKLEGGKYGLAFASGSATTSTFQLSLKQGDHVICGDDVYGGTFRFFDKVMKKFGVDYTFVDTTDTNNIKNAVNSSTKLIWLETPSNPLIKITDLSAVAKLAKDNNLFTVVDNTFASPYNQNPLKLGIDATYHSTTKYLGGHSDLVGGILVTSNDKIYEKMKFLQNASGAVPSPFDCWLAMRGIRTLSLRMEKHYHNAKAMVKFLTSRDEINRVYYPFLDSHKNSEVAKRQMKTGGGMVSFNLKGGKDAAYKFLSGLKIVSLAESLGGVESLCEYPPDMTHASVPDEQKMLQGIDPGLIRLSLGIEHVDDIINDITLGLNNI